mmetsp:Transcript_9704/g.28913  ORF Transcript_9704/g.28913 Transcript_9704/m.28913 type:complete len:224 (+) Transcript_9704:448-1119(+)
MVQLLLRYRGSLCRISHPHDATHHHHQQQHHQQQHHHHLQTTNVSFSEQNRFLPASTSTAPDNNTHDAPTILAIPIFLVVVIIISIIIIIPATTPGSIVTAAASATTIGTGSLSLRRTARLCALVSQQHSEQPQAAEPPPPAAIRHGPVPGDRDGRGKPHPTVAQPRAQQGRKQRQRRPANLHGSGPGQRDEHRPEPRFVRSIPVAGRRRAAGAPRSVRQCQR